MNSTNRSRPVRTLLILTILSTLVVACGSGESQETAAVDIEDNQYTPADLAVETGQSVVWTNHDDVPHTVTFTEGDVASSEQLQGGDEFSTTFDTAGTYAYVCALHPEMSGTVTVTG